VQGVKDSRVWLAIPAHQQSDCSNGETSHPSGAWPSKCIIAIGSRGDGAERENQDGVARSNVEERFELTMEVARETVTCQTRQEEQEGERIIRLCTETRVVVRADAKNREATVPWITDK
jgi:hypothetical protein